MTYCMINMKLNINRIVAAERAMVRDTATMELSSGEAVYPSVLN